MRRTTDMPMLVMLTEQKGVLTTGRFLRAADLVNNLGEDNNPDWKTIAINHDGRLTSPNGAIGYRWGQSGKWNLEQKDKEGELELQLTLKDNRDELVDVAFPYFGGAPQNISIFNILSTPIFRCGKSRPSASNWPMAVPRWWQPYSI
ncbi:hypothetical protein ALON55S_07627 [Alishewanella longhuensis]